ncbi:hypothetical protein PSPO01_00979 [Paraphaeosphaeria sporulosa]
MRNASGAAASQRCSSSGSTCECTAARSSKQQNWAMVDGLVLSRSFSNMRREQEVARSRQGGREAHDTVFRGMTLNAIKGLCSTTFTLPIRVRMQPLHASRSDGGLRVQPHRAPAECTEMVLRHWERKQVVRERPRRHSAGGVRPGATRSSVPWQPKRGILLQTAGQDGHVQAVDTRRRGRAPGPHRVALCMRSHMSRRRGYMSVRWHYCGRCSNGDGVEGLES